MHKVGCISQHNNQTDWPNNMEYGFELRLTDLTHSLNSKIGFTLGLGPRKLGSKTPLHAPSCQTQDWTQP